MRRRPPSEALTPIAPDPHSTSAHPICTRLSEHARPFACHSSGIGSSVSPSLAAFVGMDEELAGEQAALRLLSSGATRLAFIDHGTPIGGGPSQAFSQGRWAGFNRTIVRALGIEPARIPLGEGEHARGWDSSLAFMVRVRMQRALANTTTGLFGSGGPDDPSCRYDGLFAAGSTSLIQAAHALSLYNCWSWNGTRTRLGTVDGAPQPLSPRPPPHCWLSLAFWLLAKRLARAAGTSFRSAL